MTEQKIQKHNICVLDQIIEKKGQIESDGTQKNYYSLGFKINGNDLLWINYFHKNNSLKLEKGKTYEFFTFQNGQYTNLVQASLKESSAIQEHEGIKTDIENLCDTLRESLKF